MLALFMFSGELSELLRYRMIFAVFDTELDAYTMCWHDIPYALHWFGTTEGMGFAMKNTRIRIIATIESMKPYVLSSSSAD